MKLPPPWWSVPLLVAGCGFLFAGFGLTRNASAAPPAVAIVALVGSRLAGDLKRELEISAFTVVLLPVHATTGDWRKSARDLLNGELSRAVAVRADDRQMIVLSRSSHSGGVQVSFDLQLDSDDRPTRRRACLTVVEYLRVLGEGDDHELGAQAAAAPDREGPQVAAAMNREGTHAAAMKTHDGPGAAATMNREGPQTTVVEDQAVPEARAQPAVDAEGDGDRPSEAAAAASTRTERPWRGQPWTMGVGTTLDLSSTGWQPAGHIGFLWYFPLGPRLYLRARAEWPLLGVEFQSAGADVRVWTFGAAVGLQYAFTEAPARWRPFVGLVVGNRIALSEASSAAPLDASRSGVTPSANLGVEGGVRYALGARTQVFSELEVARDWMIPASHRMDYERATANATSLHLSVGLLFEY